MARREEIARLYTVNNRFYPRARVDREAVRLFGTADIRQMTDRQRRMYTHWLRCLNNLGWIAYHVLRSKA